MNSRNSSTQGPAPKALKKPPSPPTMTPNMTKIPKPNVAAVPLPVGIRIGPLAAQVGVGILCASYWRGMWYMCDDFIFPDNPLYSGTASLGMGISGMAITQGYVANVYQKDLQKKNALNLLPHRYTSLARFGSLYCVSASCVLVWRGVWVLWDVAYDCFSTDEVKATDRHHLTYSGMMSHFAAAAGLLAMGRFSSVLAPPANISIMKDISFKKATRTWMDYSAAAKWFFK